jgi:hypothetical protein
VHPLAAGMRGREDSTESELIANEATCCLHARSAFAAYGSDECCRFATAKVADVVRAAQGWVS